MKQDDESDDKRKPRSLKIMRRNAGSFNKLHELHADYYLSWLLGKDYTPAKHFSPSNEAITFMFRLTPRDGAPLLNQQAAKVLLAHWTSNNFLPGCEKADLKKALSQLHDCSDLVWCAELPANATPQQLEQAAADFSQECARIGRNSKYFDIRASIGHHTYAAVKRNIICPLNCLSIDTKVQAQLADAARVHVTPQDKDTLASDHVELMDLYRRELSSGDPHGAEKIFLRNVIKADKENALSDVRNYERLYPTHRMRQELWRFIAATIELGQETTAAFKRDTKQLEEVFENSDNNIFTDPLEKFEEAWEMRHEEEAIRNMPFVDARNTRRETRLEKLKQERADKPKNSHRK